MYNKVIMLGRLCTDPELKTTPNGVNVCTFRIAVDRRYQQSGEERKADFFNVAAWRQTGEFVNKYFAKGRTILIEGELTTRPYTDKNGNPSTWYEIVAERVSFTGEKAQNSGDYTAAPNAAHAAPASVPEQSASTQSADFTGAGRDPYPF